MKILFFATLLGVAQAANQAPDFKLEAYRGNLKMPLTGVVIKAPEKHHFNIKAPMYARTTATQIELAMVGASDREIRFEVESPSVAAHESIEVVAYLCDDAKTFCIKKTGSVAVASAGVPPPKPLSGARMKIVDQDVNLPNAKPQATPKPSPTPKAAARKDAHGFWNDFEAAKAEALRLKKPLMIDFYGIWCPPCNLYNETVFPTAAFKSQSKNFVLVKIDADQNESWPAKSRYRIGGYPTIVFAKPNGDEIDRAVGFFPTAEFTSRMKDAYQNREVKFEDRVMLSKAKYLDSLQTLVELKIEQNDPQEALRYAREGLMLKSDDLFFKVAEIAMQAKADPKILKKSDVIGFLKKVWESRNQATVPLLLRYQDLILSNTDSFPGEMLGDAIDALEALKSRVNPQSLYLDGHEVSVADIHAMLVDAYEAAGKPDQAKQSVKNAIDSNRALMKKLNTEQSRGLNLELAYFLAKDGQTEAAEAIYENFMKKYPEEFTYYFAAARYYHLVAKNLKRARECADQAVKFSYGDNRLRSMTRLLDIRVDQGEAKAGIDQAREVLAKVPSMDGFSIRTGRYVAALEKSIEKAKQK